MLLIPIGQEDDVVRRQPWVSFAVIAACFAIFLALLPAEQISETQVTEHFERLGDYWQQRPHLDLPGPVLELLSEGPRARVEAQHAEALETHAEWSATDTAEQAELDRLGDELLAALAARPLFRFGFVPARGGLATALSSLFLHAGWLHLLGNLLFFFLSGPFLEDRFGRVLFGLLYATSGIAAVVAHAAAQPTSEIPLVGASGAIAGVMGAFLLRLGTARIRFLFIPILVLPFLRFKPLLPAFVVLPLWFAEQAYYASAAGAGSGVAFDAHVSGFLFGALFALVVRLSGIEERVIHPAIEAETTLVQHPALELAIDARSLGDYDAAHKHLASLMRDQPDSLDGWAESYELACARQDAAGLGRAGARLFDLYARAKEPELAATLARDRRWQVLTGIGARLPLAAASVLERLGDRRSAIEALELGAREGARDVHGLRARVRQGQLLKAAGNQQGARQALEAARQHPSCEGSWIETIERGLLELERAPGKSQ